MNKIIFVFVSAILLTACGNSGGNDPSTGGGDPNTGGGDPNTGGGGGGINTGDAQADILLEEADRTFIALDNFESGTPFAGVIVESGV